MPNDMFQNSKNNKYDEFYTSLNDIEKELNHYQNHFKNKKIWLPCDNSLSDFVDYFHNIDCELKFTNSDFRENIQLWEWADLIITNPPFSLFREFVDYLIKYDKKFLIVGPLNAISYKDTFKLIKENKLWLGVNKSLTSLWYFNNHQQIEIITNKESNLPNTCTWFTNLEHNKRNQDIHLVEWDDSIYHKYENYDAYDTIWLNGIPKRGRSKIPKTRNVLGVPITYLFKHNPNQFTIIGGCPMDFVPSSIKKQIQLFGKEKGRVLSNCAWGTGQIYMKVPKEYGKYKSINSDDYYAVPYARIFIKYKGNEYGEN